jgi:hypothetical protein
MSVLNVVEIDQGKDAGGFTYGCMKLLTAATQAKSPHVIFQWNEGRSECTTPYMHASCYYLREDDMEMIRFKTLNDEVLVRGYNLAEVKKALDGRKLEILRVSPKTDAEWGDGQPVVLSIEVHDNV